MNNLNQINEDDDENYPFNRTEYKVDEMKFNKSYDKKELLKIVSTFDETEVVFEPNGDILELGNLLDLGDLEK